MTLPYFGSEGCGWVMHIDVVIWHFERTDTTRQAFYVFQDFFSSNSLQETGRQKPSHLPESAKRASVKLIELKVSSNTFTCVFLFCTRLGGET